MEEEKNAICHFVSEINSLLIEVTKPYYRFKSEFPIDAELLSNASSISAAYFLKKNGLGLDYPGIYDLGLNEEETIKMKDAYIDMPTEVSACFIVFTQKLENLIKEKAFLKSKKSYVLVPNLGAKRREIENF